MAHSVGAMRVSVRFLSIVKNLRNWILAMYCIIGTVISGYTNCRKGEKDVSGNSNNSCFE